LHVHAGLGFRKRGPGCGSFFTCYSLLFIPRTSQEPRAGLTGAIGFGRGSLQCRLEVVTGYFA
jgi:hypothetical protein